MPPSLSQSATEHLDEPVLPFARKDFTTLQQNDTVEEALAAIRSEGVGERVVYFYVVDDAARLAGVVPTRRLLTTALDRELGEIMIRTVIAIPDTATVMTMIFRSNALAGRQSATADVAMNTEAVGA
jgi:magnesium transporter